jgi:hypothetical protein
MFGKGALLVTLSFAISFSIYQLKMSRAVVNAADNFVQQYANERLYHAKISALDMGIAKMWNENFLSGSFNVVMNQCSTQVSVVSVGLDTLKLKVRAWTYVFDEHEYARSSKNLMLRDSVIAFFKYKTPVSRFFWFTENEGLVHWITGDTVWGPLHTNGLLRMSGSPTFFGKVTAKQGITPMPTDPSNLANFLGGWEIGNNNVVDTDMSSIITAATIGNGAAPTNTKSIYNEVTTFEFIPPDNIVRTVGNNPPDTVTLASIAPTGVIYSTKDVHLKGILDGRLSIYTTENIIIEDDIKYADDPQTNPSSNDMLGLIAGKNVIIADNPANNDNVIVQASIMAMNGSFMAENYENRPVSGQLNLLGSVYQKDRGAVGTFNWGSNTLRSGFQKNYRFDDRLGSQSPPYYPYVRNIELLAWWE